MKSLKSRDKIKLLLIFCYFSLTVMSLTGLGGAQILYDLNGHPHEVRIENVYNTILTGWLFYLGGLILNVVFYKVT